MDQRSDRVESGVFGRITLHSSSPASSPGADLLERSQRFLAWWLDYEQGVAGVTGPDYRISCHRAFDKLPKSTPWLPPAAGLEWLARVLTPVMALFNLPGEAATAVVLGSIRKDGLAIGLLDSDWGALKIALETPAQVFTAVSLVGVLLPCLVTLFTIGKEMRWKFAAKLAGRQMAWAAGFSLIIAWVGLLIV